MIQVALFLVAKCFPVADQELKIARVRLVNGRVVDFVDDAMAEREPDPAARMISGAETFLGAGGPAGFDSGCAECEPFAGGFIASQFDGIGFVIAWYIISSLTKGGP